MSDTLQAAKDGDVKALEALMNKSFTAQTIRVTYSGSRLKVSVRGTEPPPKSLAAKIRKGINTIAPAGFTEVAVTAETVGKGRVWQDNWQIGAAPSATPSKVTTAREASTQPTRKATSKQRWYLQGGPLIGFGITALIVVTLAGQAVSGLGEFLSDGSDHIEAADEHAREAAVLASDASTETEWNRAARKWNAAIDELNEVPTRSRLYDEAKAKRIEFRELARNATVEAGKTELAATQSGREAIDLFMQMVREIDPSSSLITSAKLAQFDDDNKTVVVTVATGWHIQPKPTREDAATGLYTMWVNARLASGANREETAYMRIENASGTEVGGYGPLKGIYIKD